MVTASAAVVDLVSDSEYLVCKSKQHTHMISC